MLRERNLHALPEVLQTRNVALIVCHYGFQLINKRFKKLLQKLAPFSSGLITKSSVGILPTKKNLLSANCLNDFACQTSKLSVKHSFNFVCTCNGFVANTTGSGNYLSTSFSAFKVLL